MATQPNDPQSYVIETHELGKSYKGVTALRGLNLKVPRHSIFGFLGPNGAGKTTTIKLLLGLARPTAGSARVFGLDCARDSVAIRRRVGFLAQEPRYYEYMSARETLRFTARFFYDGPRDAVEARVAETLELVGLASKADRPIRGFSGGERQRLGIAQAQINYPDLLILDEPAAALDPMGRRDVLEVMERLRQHTTIFYSTHILADVQRVSDSVAILGGGQLLAQAPIDDLLASRQGGAIYSLVVSGNLMPAAARLASQPWVNSLRVLGANGHTRWEISVADEEQAELRLVSLVQAEGDVRVAEFGRKRYDLEEVFMSIVGGESNGR
ncbi:MAG: ABC transporter ATP-binding protein [Chloroflexota bacterium]